MQILQERPNSSKAKSRVSSTFTNFLPISHLYWRRNRVETVQKKHEGRGKWTFPTLYFRNKFATINLSRFPNIKLKNLFHVIFYFWHDRKLLWEISIYVLTSSVCLVFKTFKNERFFKENELTRCKKVLIWLLIWQKLLGFYILTS